MHITRLARLALFVFCVFGVAACGEDSSVATAPDSAQTPEQKFAKYMKEAEQGDARAQFAIGEMLEKGDGVTSDFNKAMEWFLKAAKQGEAGAQFRIGEALAENRILLLEGQHLLVRVGDLPEGAESADNPVGDPTIDSSRRELAKENDVDEPLALLDNQKEAAEWFRKAALQGHYPAQAWLGVMLLVGRGVEADKVEAVKWLRSAAVAGDPLAQVNLAVCYLTGSGVAKDAAIAADWLRKAAIQGQKEAQYRLGVLHADGDGVSRDFVLAYAWINLAAAQEDERAARIRNRLEALMERGQIQEAQQLSSGWKKGLDLLSGSSDVGGASRESGTQTGKVKRSTGTLFFVSKAGFAVTNAHAVDGCSELRVEGYEHTAKLITEDKVNDLALLQVTGEPKAVAVVAKSPDKLRQGEEIVVFGFPLRSMLSSGGNLTPGVISALTGLGNNTNQLQVTAAIQPGSSGSPVLNKKGEVVGVVSMKLSDKEMAKATGSVGQNVNFAVNAQTLVAFLNNHGVEYRTVGLMTWEKSVADIADEARKWTSVVECWK